MSETLSEAVRLLGRLRDGAGRVTIDSARAVPILRMGLITTLYFRQGHTLDARFRIDACFARFYETFRPLLKWQHYQHVRKLAPSSFARCRRQILDGSPHEPLLWSLSSADASQVANYQLLLTCTPQEQADTDLCCMKMVLPWAYLTESGGVGLYEGWIKFLCGQLHAEHGYGGLGCILPFAGHRHLSLEYRLALSNNGLMVDSGPHLESLRLLNRIKGVSWYTVLGQRFVRQLGGNDRLRGTLSSHSDITFHAYDGGLLVRAGVLPDLLPATETPPLAYRALNKVLRPIRLQDTGCLHPYPIPGPCFTKETTAQWYARFDDKPKPAVNAGQPCPETGNWFSNAKARSRRFFQQGEVMPAFEHLKPERTQWFWAD
ncbi:type VI immunity family protein [Pseudomonas sp. DSP3-2-2]|uniref:type VI immunity family protein n=1 Tax=unclassified Pseudomonas TaxID=196821 RepID=UPI003CF9EA77